MAGCGGGAGGGASDGLPLPLLAVPGGVCSIFPSLVLCVCCSPELVLCFSWFVQAVGLP